MKSKKKIVLAGLALLAITMVLLPLSGCKTEVEWELAARKGALKSDYSYNGTTFKGDYADEQNEWVWDWYSSSYYQVSGNSVNPRGPD